MAKTKERKFIELALKSCGFSDEEGNFKKLEDIKNHLSEWKEQKNKCLDIIENMKDNIDQCNENIEAFEIIIHQVLVEEMKELNKGKKIIIT